MKRVLFAEDEALIAILFEDALSEAGYEVATAVNGDVAMALIERQGFDALITDVRMPGRVTGWDIARRMRELNPSAAIVFMSGDSMQDHKDLGVPGSIMHHKPVPVDDVLQSLHQLLSAS